MEKAKKLIIWLTKNLINKTKVVSVPIWKITKEGSDEAVEWKDHQTNPRFAIFNCLTPDDPSNDLVVDKETGLVWTRNANPIGSYNWLDSNTLCREFVLCNRVGWRLPTIEEISSLVDRNQSNPALPSGHPFLDIQFGASNPTYWTSTNSENPTSAAWFLNFNIGAAGLGNKSITGYVWPVRGGSGGNNWNW